MIIIIIPGTTLRPNNNLEQQIHTSGTQRKKPLYSNPMGWSERTCALFCLIFVYLFAGNYSKYYNYAS
jgi:hypothetical protein